MRRRAKASVIVVGSLLALAWTPVLAITADANPAEAVAEAADPESLQTIEVVGERAGPGLWQVSRGERTVYVLGTYDPLPKKMVWRSRQVEKVLDQAAQLIPYRSDVDADIGPIRAVRLYRQWRKLRLNPDGKTLADVLPSDAYARFDAARTRYLPRDRGILRQRPLLAALELTRAAVSEVGLRPRGDIVDAVVKLAKKRDVEVVKLRIRVDDPQAMMADLERIDPQTEQACLDATVARIDADVSSLRDRAQAWAIGDIEALRSQHADEQQESCWSALMSAPRIRELANELDNLWLAAVSRSLETHASSLAVAPISRLLQRDGLLADLVSRGYAVTPP